MLPITKEYLSSIICYDKSTGIFKWRIYRSATAIAGSIAGNTSHVSGYRLIKISRKSYLAHRLAWLYVYGEWPVDEIDHINGITDDNRIDNLRQATRKQNQQNIRMPKSTNKASGFLGVHWHNQNKKWEAKIRDNGKTIHLGLFDDPYLAHLRYVETKRKIHEFCTI